MNRIPSGDEAHSLMTRPTARRKPFPFVANSATRHKDSCGYRGPSTSAANSGPPPLRMTALVMMAVAIATLAVSASGQNITGTVTNATTGKPVAAPVASDLAISSTE